MILKVWNGTKAIFQDPVVLAAAIETFEIVFHLVHNSTPQSANLDIPGDFQTVTATLALLELSRKLPIKRIVFVSSGGVLYGPAEQIPTAETAPTDPITAYGVSKLTIEKDLTLYERLHDSASNPSRGKCVWTPNADKGLGRHCGS